MGKLRKRFNWKARQNPQGRETCHEDTNTLVILPKENKDGTDVETCTVNKKNKLNSKQKKRLQKVIMIKEQKAKVSGLILMTVRMVNPVSVFPLAQNFNRKSSENGTTRYGKDAPYSFNFIIENEIN